MYLSLARFVGHDQAMPLKIRSAALRVLAAAMSIATMPSQVLAEPAWPVAMRDHMSKVANVAWHLSGAADSLCRAHSARTGLLVDYIGAYDLGDRAAVSELLGLGTLPQIAAVVPGSAAARAGLKVGDEIEAIDGESTATLQARATDPDLLADDVEEALGALPVGAAAHLAIRRQGVRSTATLTPDRGCAARFIVTMGKGVKAFSDPRNVALDADLVAFTRTDDEIAMIAGHELAHVINGDARTKGMPQRAKEDRADVVGARIARCAGYDLDTALAFWVRFKQRDGLSFLRMPTHSPTDTRIALIRAYAMEGPCPPSPEFTSPDRRPR
jgi:hypothetical protein